MAQIYLPGWVGGLTVIIIQISVQIVFNWNWPTGTELSKKVCFVVVVCHSLQLPEQKEGLLVIDFMDMVIRQLFVK